jgi:hypothetical protein
MLSLVLCFSLVFPVSAFAAPTAKQVLINQIIDADFASYLENAAQINSGNYKLTLTALDGALVADIDELRGLAGTSVELGYKLNEAAKQLEIDYNLRLKQEDYLGQVYVTDKNVIFSTEALLKLIQSDLIDPSVLGNQDLMMLMEEKPQYYYVPSGELDAVWQQQVSIESMAKVAEKTKELLVFFVDALPEKYISFSLRNQSIVLTLNSDGLADVIFSLAQKTTTEPDRLAGLIADIVTAVVPDVERGEIIAGIKDGLDGSGESIPSKDEIKKAIESVFLLQELRLELGLAPKNNSFALTGNFTEDSGLKGDLKINASISGNKDNYTGTTTVNMNVTALPDAVGSLTYLEESKSILEEMSGSYEMSVKVQGGVMLDALDAEIGLKGEYGLSPKATSSKNDLKVLVKNDQGRQLNLGLAFSSNAKADPDMSIPVPQLTAANSFNMEKFQSNAIQSIYVNGTPVYSTSYYGKMVVPLRETAQLLGCQVEWIEPDQIIITRDGVEIDMNLDSFNYTINGEQYSMEIWPVLIDGTTMVSFRVFVEALDCTYSYRGRDNTIFIREN